MRSASTVRLSSSQSNVIAIGPSSHNHYPIALTPVYSTSINSNNINVHINNNCDLKTGKTTKVTAPPPIIGQHEDDTSGKVMIHEAAIKLVIIERI